MGRTEKVAGPVELIAVAAGLLVGAGMVVYPVQHHAGFALVVIGALALIAAVWFRFRPKPEPVLECSVAYARTYGVPEGYRVVE